MFYPESISEQSLFGTIRIETDQCFGTGFFFEYASPQRRICLVTNKHVIEGASEGKLTLRESIIVNGRPQPADNLITVRYQEFEKLWIRHPDPNVDLCVCPLSVLEQAWIKMNRRAFICYIREEYIPTAQDLVSLDAVEDVLMFGYPNGLQDTHNNFPIIRKGITASHPSIDFEGKRQGALDIATFMGSSGSPVIIWNKGFRKEKNGAISDVSWMLFLGVIWAAGITTAQGDVIIANIPSRKADKTLTQVMTNIGFYEKSRSLLDIVLP